MIIFGARLPLRPNDLALKPDDTTKPVYRWIQERAKRANLPIDSMMLTHKPGLQYEKAGLAIAFPLIQIGLDGKPLKGTGRFNTEIRTAGLHYDFFAGALDPPEPDIAAVVGIIITAEAKDIRELVEGFTPTNGTIVGKRWVGTPTLSIRFYEAVPLGSRKGFRLRDRKEKGIDAAKFLIDSKLVDANEIGR